MICKNFKLYQPKKNNFSFFIPEYQIGKNKTREEEAYQGRKMATKARSCGSSHEKLSLDVMQYLFVFIYL